MNVIMSANFSNTWKSLDLCCVGLLKCWCVDVCPSSELLGDGAVSQPVLFQKNIHVLIISGKQPFTACKAICLGMFQFHVLEDHICSLFCPKLSGCLLPGWQPTRTSVLWFFPEFPSLQVYITLKYKYKNKLKIYIYFTVFLALERLMVLVHFLLLFINGFAQKQFFILQSGYSVQKFIEVVLASGELFRYLSIPWVFTVSIRLLCPLLAVAVKPFWNTMIFHMSSDHFSSSWGSCILPAL